MRSTQTQHNSFVSRPKHVADKYRVVWTVLLVTDRYSWMMLLKFPHRLSCWAVQQTLTDKPAVTLPSGPANSTKISRGLSLSQIKSLVGAQNPRCTARFSCTPPQNYFQIFRPNCAFQTQNPAPTLSSFPTPTLLQFQNIYFASRLHLLEGRAGTRTFRVVNFVSPSCASTSLVNQQYSDTSGCLIDTRREGSGSTD